MEHKEGVVSGVTFIATEAPSNYHVAPKAESSNPPFVLAQESSIKITGNPQYSLAQESSAQATGTPPFAISRPGPGMVGSFEKKKRGRPRKYVPDGVVGSNSRAILSPTPISAKPLSESGDFSDMPTDTQPPSGGFSSEKKGKARVNASEAKQKHRNGDEDLGDGLTLSTGGTFVPHVLTVNAGEDVSMKIMNLSQEGSRSICIICASGLISNVTLRQSDSSGGTMTYEGRFQILSLSGSFIPTEVGGFHLGRSGGISISLSSADGRIVGGILAGLLIAASPVRIIVGSFLPCGYVEPKQKKHKYTRKPSPAATMNSPVPSSYTGNVDHPIFDGRKPSPAATMNSPVPSSYTGNVDHPIFDGHDQSHHGTGAGTTSNGIGSSSASDLNSDDWADMHLGSDAGRSTTDINIPLQGE